MTMPEHTTLDAAQLAAIAERSTKDIDPVYMDSKCPECGFTDTDIIHPGNVPEVKELRKDSAALLAHIAALDAEIAALRAVAKAAQKIGRSPMKVLGGVGLVGLGKLVELGDALNAIEDAQEATDGD
jgi:hypothetical protein